MFDAIETRLATPHDLLAILENEHSGCPHPLREDRLREIKKDRNLVTVVATSGSTVMGHSVYGVIGKVLCVERLVVGRDYQRNGVGAVLMADVKFAFDRTHCDMVMILVPDLSDYLPAHKFLSEKCGFYGRIASVSGDDSDLIQFTCRRQPERPAYVNRLSSIMG